MQIITNREPAVNVDDKPLQTLMADVAHAKDSILDRSCEAFILRRVSPETNLVIPDFTADDTDDIQCADELGKWCEESIIDGDESGLGLLVEIVDEKFLAPTMIYHHTIWRGRVHRKVNVRFERREVRRTKLGQVIAVYDVECEVCI